MTRLLLNTYGKGLENLSSLTVKDFKVKIKIARLMKWFKEEVELIAEGQKAITDKYILENKFDEKGIWGGTPEEYLIYKSNVTKANAETLELLKTDCIVENTIFLSEDEMTDIDCTPDDLASLMLLGILS